MRRDETTVARSRKLRTNLTEAEQTLWYQLRKRQIGGYKFRRQHPIDSFIVDFVCLEKGLVVEVDGGQHQANEEYDERRSQRLKQLGFDVVRFWNNEVLGQIEAVTEAIHSRLTQ